MKNPSSQDVGSLTVNDITRINPISVSKIVTPNTTEEIASAIKMHDGPISIGGGRYSMGGQTATEDALQIDMRSFNHVYPPEGKTIRVQTGATWRQIQEVIDGYDLSVKIMQSYANFTVGGALSVNAHGRYIGHGPIVSSVISIQIVLADGSIVTANREENRDLFFAAIGGYGGVGVITEAILSLDDNTKIETETETMNVADYPAFFHKNIKGAEDVIFHNADLYPNQFDTVRTATFRTTNDELTNTNRLQPKHDYSYYRWNRLGAWIISEWPMGKLLKERIIDSRVYPSGSNVVWRNFEASYDVAELEPASRETTTYVLQEYFIPVGQIDLFIPRLRHILQTHRVNVLNISIRHAKADPDTYLSWARSDVFAFVMYYKQHTDKASREKVGMWTRELIDAAISVGGAYYLPYQILATDDQFHASYPRAKEYFALKQKLDPQNKFRNKLWDRYYAK
jgi:FAD/FMN-containing dehydrogenase